MDVIASLETLPNEILLDVFRYFDAQALFEAFDGLNSRFHRLLRSFHQLKLSLLLTESKNNLLKSTDLFPSFVHAMNVDPHVQIDFTRFGNTRCLKLDWLSSEKLQQLCSNALPHLERLTLMYIEVFPSNDGLMCMPSLRRLKVQFINLSIYQILLSICPNLRYFQLTMFTSEEYPIVIEPHANLRQLNIKIGDVVWPWNDRVVDKYLSCAPGVERFVIHRSLYISRTTSTFLEYDWLASIVNIRLSALGQLDFHLRSFSSKHLTKTKTEEVLEQLKRRFTACHHDRYQARLMIEYS